MDPCPCHSQLPYVECCKRYHLGGLPENALKLMRSRYAAYALGLYDYIIQTTHLQNPAYQKDFIQWKKGIQEFYKNTRFEGLDILEFIDGDKKAYVTFTARLSQGGHDATFTEKSTFEKVAGRWLYRAGEKMIEMGT